MFDECITVYVTVCKYFRSLMTKKGKFETWTLPVAIVYISQWPRPVWQWPMSVDIGNSALQQRPFPMETVEERMSWAFLGGTSWFVCSSEKLKQVDSFSQSWQQGAVALQRKAVHLSSSSQRDRNKGVKALTFRPPMAKLAAAASARAITEQVSGRDPKICLHRSSLCEVYGGR